MKLARHLLLAPIPALILAAGCQVIGGFDGFVEGPGTGGAATASTSTGEGGDGGDNDLGDECTSESDCEPESDLLCQPEQGGEMNGMPGRTCVACNTVHDPPPDGCMATDCNHGSTCSQANDACELECTVGAAGSGGAGGGGGSGAGGAISNCGGSIQLVDMRPLTQRVICNPGACDGLELQCNGPVGCEVVCEGPGSCYGLTVECSPDGPCEIDCSSDVNACNNTTLLNCGNNACTIGPPDGGSAATAPTCTGTAAACDSTGCPPG